MTSIGESQQCILMVHVWQKYKQETPQIINTQQHHTNRPNENQTKQKQY